MTLRFIKRIALLASVALPALGMAAQQRNVSLDMDQPLAVQRASHIGPADPSKLLHLAISMPFADEVAIERFVESVSDPKSPNYRQFLTPEQVGQQFGLSLSQVRKLVKFLKSQGMTVTLVGKNRLTILAEATVAQAQKAFNTSIEEYASNDPSDAADPYRFSFSTAPSVPAELGPIVTNVSGMEDFTRPKKQYLTPSQTHVLYGTATMYAGGTKGTGRTIGISSWDGFRLTNAAAFISYYALPVPSAGATSNVKIETVDGGSGTGVQHVEGDLDIQSTLAVAPLANVIVYDGSGADIINVLTQEVNDNTADIITESYGWSLAAATATSAHTLHLSMTAQGITYLAASGDTGTTITYGYPDCETEVLVVGGTSTTTDTTGDRTTEVGWPDSGGGWVTAVTNTFNVKPSYQSAVGPSGVNYRLFPDVAANADPNTGYTLYLEAGTYPTFTLTTAGVYEGFGGTSAASPTMAASLALAEQQIISQGGLAANSAGKQRFGRINDLLYSYSGLSSVFFDVTSGTNGSLPNGTTSTATTGWDMVTGWGALNFQGLVNEVVGVSVSGVTLSSTSLYGGLGTTVTGTVTLTGPAPAAGTAVSLVSSSTSATLSSASITIASGKTSGTFTFTAAAVNAATAVTFSAKSGTTVTASATIEPAVLSSISVSSTSVLGGVTNPTATVTLNAPAGPSGSVVTLASSASAAKFSVTSVTVAAGKTTATAVATTIAVAATTAVTLTATDEVAKTATLSVTAPTLSSLTLSSSSLTGNGSTSVTGTVTLSGPAGPSGVTITLKSSNTTDVTVPASVTVAAGAKTATFTFKPAKVTKSAAITITATLGTTSTTAVLTDA